MVAGSAFGDLLKRYRGLAGLTQEDLAERAGLTPQGIGLLERGERRRPQRYTVRKLAEALNLSEPDRARFDVAARDTGNRATTLSSRQDLTASATPLIGRDSEAAAVVRLLSREDVRLLTLIGPGGVGKTRLALEAAGRSRDAFAGGVFSVSLAPLRDPDLVLEAIVEALGVRSVKGQTLRETVILHLRGRQVLLLLDNFEHLLDAAPVVADLLGASPELTVLATSRAPLRLSGEHQYPVPPLPIPDSSVSAQAPMDSLASSPAVELFRQRARAVAPGFEFDATNAEAVAGICRRLDGLPLAIELAAARVKLLPPRALLARLDGGLRLLTGGACDLPEHQRTLRDTIAWSHDLLDADEQTLFRHLAVFAGGCTLEAAEAVCEADEPGESVLETLASLVDNSLLVPRSEYPECQEDEEPRFTMLETIREYAHERLESSGEAGKVRRNHARYYLTLVEAMQPEVYPRRQEGTWIADMEEEHDNLRAALRWTIREREAEIGGRLV